MSQSIIFMNELDVWFKKAKEQWVLVFLFFLLQHVVMCILLRPLLLLILASCTSYVKGRNWCDVICLCKPLRDTSPSNSMWYLMMIYKVTKSMGKILPAVRCYITLLSVCLTTLFLSQKDKIQQQSIVFISCYRRWIFLSGCSDSQNNGYYFPGCCS